MAGFVKVYGTILDSSIWLEAESTRIVFLTMLLACDRDGYVAASVGGLAHKANTSREKCEAALAILEAPDGDSRTPDNDGRRIEKVQGGWKVLNYQHYREMRTEKQIEDADRQARHRAQKQGKDPSRDSRDMSRDISQIADSRLRERVKSVDVELVVKAVDDAIVSLCNRLPITATDAVHELAERSKRPKAWAAAVSGMLDGLGAPRGIPVTPAKMAQALIELAATDFATTPATLRGFLARADREPPASSTTSADGVSTLMRDLIAKEEQRERHSADG